MNCGKCDLPMTSVPLRMALALVESWGDDATAMRAEPMMDKLEAGWCDLCQRLAIDLRIAA